MAEACLLRLPENVITLSKLSNFSPTVALSPVKQSTGPICKAFPQLITDMDDVESE
jgi:hypothetical protein